MRVVGLTGGIGSGKSTVARMLHSLGATIVDADVLAREAVAAGSAGLAEIVTTFGEQVLAADGCLDRKALGAVVFSDPLARKKLEAITHPRVAALAMARFQEANDRGDPLIIYDVPLLYENGLERMLPRVIVVFASDANRWARIKARDGLTDDEISARFAAQQPLDDKVRQADFVINNDHSPDETERQVHALFERLTTAKGAAPP